MKKYNSVFTLCLSIDHDMEDASDITPEDIIEAIKLRCEDIRFDHPMETLVEGPDDTFKL